MKLFKSNSNFVVTFGDSFFEEDIFSLNGSENPYETFEKNDRPQILHSWIGKPYATAKL